MYIYTTTNNVYYLNEKQLLWCKLIVETYLKLSNCNNCTKIKELFSIIYSFYD